MSKTSLKQFLKVITTLVDNLPENDVEKFDSKVAQAIIDGRQTSGREFMRFLENGARVNIVNAKNLALKHLLLVQEGITITTVEFSKLLFFTSGPKLYFWDNFKNWVLPEIPDILPAFQGTLSKYTLTKSMYNKEIQEELGGPTPFTVSEFVAIIQSLILKQPKGEDGTLLTNGYANIFYVKLGNGRVVAVFVYWHPDNRSWGFRAFSLAGDCWGSGRRVFSHS